MQKITGFKWISYIHSPYLAQKKKKNLFQFESKKAIKVYFFLISQSTYDTKNRSSKHPAHQSDPNGKPSKLPSFFLMVTFTKKKLNNRGIYWQAYNPNRSTNRRGSSHRPETRRLKLIKKTNHLRHPLELPKAAKYRNSQMQYKEGPKTNTSLPQLKKAASGQLNRIRSKRYLRESYLTKK